MFVVILVCTDCACVIDEKPYPDPGILCMASGLAGVLGADEIRPS